MGHPHIFFSVNACQGSSAPFTDICLRQQNQGCFITTCSLLTTLKKYVSSFQIWRAKQRLSHLLTRGQATSLPNLQKRVCVKHLHDIISYNCKSPGIRRGKMRDNPALWLYNNIQGWLVRETKKKAKGKGYFTFCLHSILKRLLDEENVPDIHISQVK
jgi:hypothetical protein